MNGVLRAHARRVSNCKTESDVKTAQGYRFAKVACTLTALVGEPEAQTVLKKSIS